MSDVVVLTEQTIRTGRIIVLSGPSGVGKNTVVDGLVKANLIRKFNIHFSVSLTTRAPRAHEVAGKHYHFISRAQFRAAIERGEMAEYAQFLNNYYGTSKPQLTAALAAGKNVLLEIEMKGAMQIMSHFPDALSIFLLPPSMKELTRRMEKRATESAAMIKLRLQRAHADMQYQNRYQYRVLNQKLEQTVTEIGRIFARELNYPSVTNHGAI